MDNVIIQIDKEVFNKIEPKQIQEKDIITVTEKCQKLLEQEKVIFDHNDIYTILAVSSHSYTTSINIMMQLYDIKTTNIKTFDDLIKSIINCKKFDDLFKTLLAHNIVIMASQQEIVSQFLMETEGPQTIN